MNYRKISTNLPYISKITTRIPITLYGIIFNKDQSISVYELCQIKSELNLIDYALDILEKYSEQSVDSTILDIPYNELVLLCIYGLYGKFNHRNIHQVYENIKKGFHVNNPFQFSLYYTCEKDNFSINVF